MQYDPAMRALDLNLAAAIRYWMKRQIEASDERERVRCAETIKKIDLQRKELMEAQS